MTLRHLAHQYAVLLSDIQSLEDEAQMLRESAGSPGGSRMSGMPRGSGVSDPVSVAVTRVCEVTDKAANLKADAENLRLQLCSAIAKIVNVKEQREVCFDRFVLGLSYFEISKKRYISEDWARQIVRRCGNFSIPSSL